MSVCLAVCATIPANAAVMDARFAVVIGSNLGADDEVPLRYAERDAQRLAQTLRRLGQFSTGNVVELYGTHADSVMQKLTDINETIRKKRQPDNSVLVVYYSGHADATDLHLGGSLLPLRKVKRLVQASTARYKVLVLDACRSGAATRTKGAAAAPPFAIQLSDRLTSEGFAVITSSAANELSQESDDLRGSYFTHHLISGLMGAADVSGDMRVSLEEAYAYAYSETIATTSQTLAGIQHPTFQFDTRGHGELLLTDVAAQDGRTGLLELPAGGRALVLGGASGTTVAEVSDSDRARRLRLPAGPYVVRIRRSAHYLEGTFAVRAGAATTVAMDAMQERDYAVLAQKGGGSLLGRGTVVISTEPAGGSVFVQGRAAGVAPLTLDDVPAGELAISATLGDLAGHRSLVLQPNSVARVALNLQQTPSVALKILTTPAEADITIDNQSRGRSPVVIEDLAPGAHLLRVSAPGYVDTEKTISVQRDAFEKQGFTPFVEELTLDPAPVGVTLQGLPAGARIQIDGAAATHEVRLLPGHHKVAIAAPGYERRELDLSIPVGDDLEVSATLTAQPNYDAFLKARRGRRIVALGLGAAAVAASALGAVSLTRAEQAFDHADKDYARYKRMATSESASIAYDDVKRHTQRAQELQRQGVGLVAAAATCGLGVVLTIWSVPLDPTAPDARPSRGAQLLVSPGPSGSMGISVLGHF